jgi:hypothetical protein
MPEAWLGGYPGGDPGFIGAGVLGTQPILGPFSNRGLGSIGRGAGIPWALQRGANGSRPHGGD